jgi:hypothetical protein
LASEESRTKPSTPGSGEVLRVVPHIAEVPGDTHVHCEPLLVERELSREPGDNVLEVVVFVAEGSRAVDHRQLRAVESESPQLRREEHLEPEVPLAREEGLDDPGTLRRLARAGRIGQFVPERSVKDTHLQPERLCPGLHRPDVRVLETHTGRHHVHLQDGLRQDVVVDEFEATPAELEKLVDVGGEVATREGGVSTVQVCHPELGLDVPAELDLAENVEHSAHLRRRLVEAFEGPLHLFQLLL